MSFREKVRELLYRVSLYLFGVRFYERLEQSNLRKVHDASYIIDDRYRIDFEFFHSHCEDIVLKKSKVSKANYESYVVVARFSEAFPEYVRKYEGKQVFFNGAYNKFRGNEQATCELILDIYLDYLKIVFNTEEKLPPAPV